MNIFYKKCLFSQKEWLCFTVLQFSVISGLVEDSWILIPISAFHLLQYSVLVEVYKEKPALHNNVVEKKEYFNSLQLTVGIFDNIPELDKC